MTRFALQANGVIVCALLAAVAAACTGVIGDGTGGGSGSTGGGSGATGGGSGTTGGGSSSGSSGGESGSSSGSDGGVSRPVSGAGSSPMLNTLFAPGADPTAAGAMVLRHLTQFEYLNTVTALFGSAAVTAAQVTTAAVPAEPPVPNTSSGFPLPGLVDVTTATAYQADAEAIAKAVLPNVAKLLTCSPGTGSAAEQTCANTFVTTFGLQMYRRPLSTSEVSGLLALYQTGTSTLGLTFDGAIDLLIEEMLQSPGFLYHWELGPTATVTDPPASNPTAAGVEVQLDGYAMANRLSYFLWGTMPDQTLFAAAASNQLSTTAQVTAQATRMLEDPKAQPAVANFFEQWLGMYQLAAQPKDQTIYTTWGPALAASMDAEFQTFVKSVIFTRTGQLSELLTSATTSIDGPLATLYGASGVTGTTPASVTLNPAQRSGLLTTAAWLALNGDPASSNPVYRGHSLYTQMLCGVIPPPPPNVPPPAPASAGGTTRDRFREHDTQACAVSCHSVMDPFGYPFENYDGIGQWRTTDNDLPVDATSTVAFDGQSSNVTNAVQMVPILADSPTVQQCFNAQWMTYGMGRTVTAGDAASAQAAQVTFASSSYKVTSLLSAMASSRTFRFRTASAGEVLP